MGLSEQPNFSVLHPFPDENHNEGAKHRASGPQTVILDQKIDLQRVLWFYPPIVFVDISLKP
ncbi:hypothetical protein D3C87_1381960 [compost metagenome]